MIDTQLLIAMWQDSRIGNIAWLELKQYYLELNRRTS
jgi:hypothetical protein